MADPTLLDKVRAAWGDPLPDWIETLAIECQRSTQAAVARALDVSGAAISQVLKAQYAASTDRLQERVRGVFMDGKVRCPAKGDLATNKCLEWRDKATVFALGSPERSIMYRACNACPRFKSGGADDANH